MKLNGKIALVLALSAAGFVGLNANVQASASHFNTYKNNGAKTVHKTYISKKKYSLNKTFKMSTGYKLKIKNIYVYQVPKSSSNYKTWMKVTGTAINSSKNGSFRFGAVNNIGLTNTALAGLASTPTNFLFSCSTSKSPKMLSSIVGRAADLSTSNYLGANKKGNFELLFHSKKQVKKVGNADLFVGTFYNNTPSQGGIGEFKRAEVNVNLK